MASGGGKKQQFPSKTTSIYGLSRECRENLNIRCMRKWFWIKQAARKPHNSCSPGQDYAIASQKSDPYFSIRNMWQELSFGHFVGLLLVS